MAKLENFALRLSPELKEACRLLSAQWINSVFDGPPGQERTIYIGNSMNDVMTKLMRRGAQQLLPILSKNIDRETAETATWSEVVKFFLDHPPALAASTANFAADSSVQKIFQSLKEQAEWDDDCSTDIDRSQAFDELSRAQKRLERLVAAKGALQRVQSP